MALRPPPPRDELARARQQTAALQRELRRLKVRVYLVVRSKRRLRELVKGAHG